MVSDDSCEIQQLHALARHTASLGLLIAKFWSFDNISALFSGGNILSRILWKVLPSFPAMPCTLFKMPDMVRGSRFARRSRGRPECNRRIALEQK
jgi:hypothetical protein